MALKENARIRLFYNGFRMDSSCSQDMQGIFTIGDMMICTDMYNQIKKEFQFRDPGRGWYLFK